VPPRSRRASPTPASPGSLTLDDELTRVRARGWAVADEELAPGIRSIAVPVRDGNGAVRAAMNLTVHVAETSTEKLLDEHLPKLLRAAGNISADWATWQSPHVEISPNPEATLAE
jgi:IclR family transcriptional regulator, pca regulon regulatory protein